MAISFCLLHSTTSASVLYSYRIEIPLKRRSRLYILGAFLIPFFVMLILEGVPLFLIELGLGQRMRQGALGVWNTIHPWLGGIGIASCIVTFFVALYYNVIITWCFYYLFNSLRVSRSIREFVTPIWYRRLIGVWDISRERLLSTPLCIFELGSKWIVKIIINWSRAE